jgi:D-3-phosphoglycerate dehydrogenase
MNTLITDYGFSNLDQERDALSRAGIELQTAQCKTAAEVIAVAAHADALIVQWAPITAEVIAALKNCKVIVRYGIGVDNVDLKAAGERGIPVCNVPDYCIPEVADHSIALALSLARQLPQTDAAVRNKVWKITPPFAFAAFRELTFAVAGFGRIARAVLTRAAAFGFRLAAYDPFVDKQVFIDAGVRQVTKDELFEVAGLLSLHLPLTPETRHFINRESLARMRRDAIIINTARGGLIDSDALAAALKENRIAGAGLDVYEKEPLPLDHVLRSAPNTILTSHTAWFSASSVPELQQKAAEEAVRGILGQPLKNVVNRSFLPS